MSRKPKDLSLAQKEMLSILVLRDHQRTVANYKPVCVLRDLGLVTVESVDAPYGWKVTITDAGRRALDQEQIGGGS